MSDYLRSALGYLNGGTGGNEYVGQTLDINNVRLRVTRLIAEGESIISGWRITAAVRSRHGGTSYSRLEPIRIDRGPWSSFLASREKRGWTIARGRGEEKGARFARDICPPVMCQTCFDTRPLSADSRRGQSSLTLAHTKRIPSLLLYRAHSHSAGSDIIGCCPFDDIDDLTPIFLNDVCRGF